MAHAKKTKNCEFTYGKDQGVQVSVGGVAVKLNVAEVNSLAHFVKQAVALDKREARKAASQKANAAKAAAKKVAVKK